jgi:hypothetical protein
MKTVAVFESRAFNHTEPKEYFINPCCFGDDLARWLMDELRQGGVDVQGDPEQEDFGWYFEFTTDGEKYCLVISGDEEGEWALVIERACGLMASLLGGRHRNVGRSGVEAIEEVLTRADCVENLRWVSWEEFRRGDVLAS